MRAYHRIRVEGATPAADRLREYLHRSGYVLVPDSSYSVRVDCEEGEHLALDGVDSPLEAQILANLQELKCPHVLLKRAGGNQDPRAAVITVPPALSDAVALAVFRAIEQVGNQSLEPERPAVSAPPTRRPWWVFWVLLCLLSVPATAQTPVQIREGANIMQVTATAGGSAQVECAAGCGGGTTDTDDGSIAGGQTIGLQGALSNVWSGAGWVRLTQGQALMAASIPVTFASDQSALPVTGTFWQATQPVSATNLDVQSGGVDLATSTQGAAIQTAVELIDNAVSGAGFNTTQWGGTAVTGNNGSATAGSPRVAIAYDSGVCNPKDTSQVAIVAGSSGNNEIVALSASQTIYLCDLTLISDGTVAVQLIYGTGTACATGETNMSGPMALVVNGGWTHDYGGRLKTAEANAFCLELSGAIVVNGVLTYRKANTF